MLRRSLRIWLMIARSLLLLNFGMAIAVRMPMITTTMRSSMSVKPPSERLVIVGRLGIGLPLLSHVWGLGPEKRGDDRRPPPLWFSSNAQAYQQAGAPSCTTAAFGGASLPP